MVIGIPDKERVIIQNPYQEAQEIIISDDFVSSLNRNTTYLPNAQTLLSYYTEKYDWDWEIAYKIMYCESSGDPTAHYFSDVTKDDSWGLFQINLYGDLAKTRPPAEWLLIPGNNISYAYEIYKTEGWGAWQNCLYK